MTPTLTTPPTSTNELIFFKLSKTEVLKHLPVGIFVAIPSQTQTSSETVTIFVLSCNVLAKGLRFVLALNVASL